MLTDERTLAPGLFRLPDARVDRNILIPGFRSARSVRGAFGWFTAGWIEQLAPGLAAYLSRSDAQTIDFTVAPTLFPAERDAVERGVQMTAEQASGLVAEVFTDGRARARPLARHALDCLAWMIATQTLRLRIAVPTPESNYHPKLWLFDDGENQVLARGSGNATGKGVGTGVEHLDVDVSWQRDSRVAAGIAMLDDWSTSRWPLPTTSSGRHPTGHRPRTTSMPPRAATAKEPNDPTASRGCESRTVSNGPAAAMPTRATRSGAGSKANHRSAASSRWRRAPGKPSPR